MTRILFALGLAWMVATTGAQDVFTRGLVYQLPEMKKAVIQTGTVYRTVNDTALTFDVYYPPGFTKKMQLPVVIFNNGVGSLDLPRWKIYQDWARLVVGLMAY